jgi:tellurite resistance protein
MIVDGLNLYRDTRDAACEMMFQAIYESPGMKLLADFAGPVAPRNDRQLEELRRQDAERWRKNMTIGEFPDAMVRIFLAIGFADQEVRREGYGVIRGLFAENPRMADLELEDVRQIIREQSRIVQTDADQAIATLPRLLTGAEDRRDALAMLDQAVAAIGRELTSQEQAVLERVKTVLAA